MLNLRLARPGVLVDINGAADLDYLREADGVLAVGALVRQRALERWAADRAPLIAEALRLVGHVAIRNRGTAVGNLAHGDPASELPALLLCLDGAVVARRAGGERLIAAADLYLAPLTTSLAADEILAEARFTLPPAGAGWGFAEVARRHGDFALAGCAALLWRDGQGRVAGARIGFFGVGSTPVRGGGRRRAAGRSRADAGAVAGGGAGGRGGAVSRRGPARDGRLSPAGRGGAGGAHADRRARAVREPGMKRPVRLVVNGQARAGAAEPRTSLADFLRDDLDLTGTHVGCEHGVCGACTVLLEGEPVRACLMLAVQAEGRSVMTIEGLAATGSGPTG